MTKYKITIEYTSGKNKGRKVSYYKRRLDLILDIAKEAILDGNKVSIENFEIEEKKDFCSLILENL